MILIKLTLLLNLSVFAEAKLNCPKGFLPISYFSPVQNKQVTTCSGRIDGKLVQKAPLKKGEKASNSDEDSLEELKKKVTDSYIKVFMGLVSKSKNKGLKNFTTNGCQGDRAQWGRFLLGKIIPKEIKYWFSDECSLKGEFSPKLNTSFPMSFKVRDIKEIEKVSLNLIIRPKLSREPLGLDVRYEVENMTLIGPGLKANIEAKYRVVYARRGAVKKNYGGEITINTINDTKLNINEKVYVPIDE